MHQTLDYDVKTVLVSNIFVAAILEGNTSCFCKATFDYTWHRSSLCLPFSSDKQEHDANNGYKHLLEHDQQLISN